MVYTRKGLIKEVLLKNNILEVYVDTLAKDLTKSYWDTPVPMSGAELKDYRVKMIRGCMIDRKLITVEDKFNWSWENPSNGLLD